MAEAEYDVSDNRSGGVWIQLAIYPSAFLTLTYQSGHQLSRATLSATYDRRNRRITGALGNHLEKQGEAVRPKPSQPPVDQH
jgi:hypothetical protein